MRKTLIKESDYLIAWLFFYLISTILSIVLGFIFGLLIGVVLGAAGISMDIITAAGAVIGFLAGLPVSYITFRLTVEHFFIGKFQ